MKITRKEAVRLFKEIGYRTAKLWDDERLVKKLNRLPTIIEGTPDIPNSVTNNPDHLCNRICGEVKGNRKIELEVGESKMAKKQKDKKKFKIMSVAEYEGREEPKKEKKLKVKTGKKVKEKAKVEKKVEKKVVNKEKKERKGLNKFGYRENGKAGQIDALLSKTPITAAKIAKKLGDVKFKNKPNIDEKFVVRHLTHAIENNRGVKLTKDGYVSTI